LTAARVVLIYAPLAVLGIAAGALYALARRTPDLRRKRYLDIAWIVAVLVGAPIWLFLAATLKMW
jgi:hypothetical protein